MNIYRCDRIPGPNGGSIYKLILNGKLYCETTNDDDAFRMTVAFVKMVARMNEEQRP